MQRDVLAESLEILQLGLLFGEDIDATTTDLPEVLSFQHKLIQEYLAAVYIADTLKQGTPCSFLAETFPTWNIIENYREVIQFACGILAETDASLLTNHVGKVLSELIQKEINEGKIASFRLDIFYTLLKEGSVPLVNTHITWYPECGHPLSDVLQNTKLAVITDTDENDPLQLNASYAQIILHLERACPSAAFERLWQALHSTHASVTAIDRYRKHLHINIRYTHIRHFSQLKRLVIEDVSEAEMEDLAVSIDSWGSQPPLTYCGLPKYGSIMPTLKSLMPALSKCVHLKYLDLAGHDLHEKLSILMASLAPGLRKLVLQRCNLHADDIDHVTEAFREGRLTRLDELYISWNPIGEGGMNSLLQAISTISHALKDLGVTYTGVNEAGRYIELSEQFISEWKGKLTNIDVQWEYGS